MERPKQSPRFRRLNKSTTRILIAIGTVILLLTYLAHQQAAQTRQNVLKELNLAQHPSTVERGIVIPKVKGEDVSWILASPEWTPFIYSASTPAEPGFHALPSLRGREAMTYLTFIIDHYDTLPAITAFVHSGATQWHNDVLGAYTTSILDNLRLDNITRLGYANLRCRANPGCPISMRPFEPSAQDVAEQNARYHFPDIYAALFDVTRDKIPQHIGHTCCAQFAVTRARIRARPKTDYERMRHWITHGSVNQTDSQGVGWVFELLWHVIFSMPDTHCPSFEQCRCDLFGWCGHRCPGALRPLVKGAHPWLGMRLGNWLGNAYAFRGEEVQ